MHKKLNVRSSISLDKYQKCNSFLGAYTNSPKTKRKIHRVLERFFKGGKTPFWVCDKFFILFFLFYCDFFCVIGHLISSFVLSLSHLDSLSSDSRTVERLFWSVLKTLIEEKIASNIRIGLFCQPHLQTPHLPFNLLSSNKPGRTRLGLGGPSLAKGRERRRSLNMNRV